MQFGARLHFDASLRAAVNQREQAANFLDREAERTRAHDEAKATNVFLAIEAIAFGAAQRLGEQYGLLIVADGLEVADRGFRQLGALQAHSQGRMVNSGKKLSNL